MATVRSLSTISHMCLHTCLDALFIAVESYLWVVTPVALNAPHFSTECPNSNHKICQLVRPLWDILCWAFVNLCEDHSMLQRPLCPKESQDLSNPFTFRLITLSFKPLTFFLPNYACQRKPPQTSRLAYVCKQLGRSVPTSCLILFSCQGAAV